MQYDAIVVGSGIGGMVAALSLAKAGKRVALLEAKKQFGGYLNPFQRKKYHFDTGLHYIGECGPGQSFDWLMRDLGIADQVAFRELNPDCIDRYVFPDYQTALCKGHAAWRDRLAADFPQERDGLDRYFKFMQEIHLATSAMNKRFSLANALPIAKALPPLLRYGRATLSRLLDDFVREPLLRSALAGPCGDVGLPPSRVSGLVHTMVLNHYLRGGYYPVGGSGAIRDAMIAKLKECGAELRRNAPVARVLFEKDRVAGVALPDGEEFRAPRVLFNADATKVFTEMMPPQYVPWSLKRKAKAMQHSLASMSVFMATDLDLAGMGLTDANVWHYESNDLEEIYRPLLAGKPAEKHGFFLTIPTLKDPDGHRAPDGVHTLEIIILAAMEPFRQWEGSRSLKRGEEYQQFKEQQVVGVVDLLERHYIPGLRERLLHYEIASPLTNVSYTNSPEGGIYGPAHSPDQIGPFRFGARTKVPGVYLCGASVLGAGVIPCAMSGRMAARAALADMR